MPLYPPASPNVTRGLFGCEPDKFSTSLLQINAGSIWNYYGTKCYTFPNTVNVDLTTVGLNGYDQLGGVVNGELNIYLIANPTTGSFGWLGSASMFFGGVNVPSGYILERKLPWGVMYNTSRDGIPNFHLTHWPMPMITFTDAEANTPYTALSAGTATTWTDINLAGWIPDNARYAYLSVDVRYVSSGCSAYIRSTSLQTVGIPVGAVGSGSTSNVSTQMIRVTSDRKIQYKFNATGGSLYVYVLGYCMTEPA